MLKVMSAGHQWPCSAHCAMRSPAPKNRYQGAPPTMIARCRSAAIALSMAPTRRAGVVVFMVSPCGCAVALEPPTDGALLTLRVLERWAAARRSGPWQVAELSA